MALLKSSGVLDPQPTRIEPPRYSPDPSGLPGQMMSLPALPNTAISVEDLERNLVSGSDLTQNPGPQTPPPPLESILMPPPGLLNTPGGFGNASGGLGPNPNLPNLSLIRGMMDPWGAGGSNPWGPGTLGFPPGNFGGLPIPPPPPHAALNSFGLGGPLGPNPGQMPQLGPGPFGPFLGQGNLQRPPSPPQEKPLQLNQLPGVNFFNVRSI